MSVLLQMGMESLFFLLVFVANVASKKKSSFVFQNIIAIHIDCANRVNMQ